jgi:hypothetical protein
MSDIDTYAEELTNVFGFSFPLLPVYLNARPDSGIYSHNNPSSKTITPAHHAALFPSELPAPAPVQVRRVRFDVPINYNQEELSDRDFRGSLPMHNSRRNQHGVRKPHQFHQNFSYHFSQARYALFHQI